MNVKEEMGCLAISILVIVVGLVTVAIIFVGFNYVYGGAPWNVY